MSYTVDEKLVQKMFEAAKKALKNSYAPYSNFHVGAAVCSEDGEIFAGCNVENASYRLTQCAESLAVTNMVLAGKKNITAVLVMAPKEYNLVITPCGACRQVLREFAKLDTPIYLCNDEKILETVTLGELLPKSFGPDHLGK